MDGIHCAIMAVFLVPFYPVAQTGSLPGRAQMAIPAICPDKY
jgi:hypothetical protein